MYVRIYDNLYDISNFKHPGGKVIKTYIWTLENQKDATNVFLSFHQKNILKAKKFLNSLPIAPAEFQNKLKEREIIEKKFELLQKKLINEGWFEPDYKEIIFRLGFNALTWIVGYFLLHLNYFWTGIICCAISYKQSGWIQHEAGHNSLTGITIIDKTIQMFYFNIILSGNFRQWNDQHLGDQG